MGITDFYKDKRVLVTGHTGFKGSWLVLWLLNMQSKVYGISKGLPTKPSLFKNLELHKQIEHITADITDSERIKEIVQEVKPEIIFHLAAQPIVSTSYEDPLSTFLINGMGTAYILDALRAANHRCSIVIVTSDKCYRERNDFWGYKESDDLGGKDPYSASKSVAENIAYSYSHSFFSGDDSNVRLATARAGNVIGGGDWSLDRIVPDSMNRWKNQEKMELRNPSAVRPWQHVLDVIHGYLILGHQLHTESSLNGQAFNFGPPMVNDVDVLTLMEELSKSYGFTGDSVYEVVDNPIRESKYLRLNNEKATRILQWYPKLDFMQVVDFTASWYKSYHNDPGNVWDITKNQLTDFLSK